MINYDLTASNRKGLDARLDQLDCTKTVWSVIVKPKKSKRSLEQNKWARKFAADFARHIGYDADTAYDLLMYKCNPIFNIDPSTGNEIRMAGHLSKLNTAEAAEVQDLMIRFGIELDFYFEL